MLKQGELKKEGKTVHFSAISESQNLMFRLIESS